MQGTLPTALKRLALTVLVTILPACAIASDIRHFGTNRDLPFSQAVEVNGIYYISGQIGVDAGAAPQVADGIDVQSRRAMDSIGKILAMRGLVFDDLFKCTVMLADMADWPRFNDTYRSYFKPGRMPARSAFAAAGLAFGTRLEVECWAKVR